MLQVPEAMVGIVRTDVSETVNFFGQRLQIRAVPFMQQDARLGTCANVAAWMCHYTAALSWVGLARRPIADFSTLTNPSLQVGRPIPSTGLSFHQISDLFRVVGLPALFYDIKSLTDKDRPVEWPDRRIGREAAASRTSCRYLNSGLPVIVLAQPRGRQTTEEMHAVVLCGYKRTNAESEVSFVFHDDQRGPYLRMDGVNGPDNSGGSTLEWEVIVAPVPPKLWLTGEAAERLGCQLLLASARKAVKQKVTQAQAMLNLHSCGDLSVRTYAIDGSRWKERFAVGCSDAHMVEEHRFLRLPHYVWVVEAIDRTKRGRTPKAVLGHILFDATSDEQQPALLAIRVPGLFATEGSTGESWTTEVEYLPSTGQYGA